MKNAWVTAWLTLLINAVAGHALALDPALRLTQYGHTAWRLRDGFIDGAIVSMTQTHDGYIWLATSTQLIRFDGVRFEPWKPSAGTIAGAIVSIFGSSDGSLWIGTNAGVHRWLDDRLTTVANNGRFEPFVEDATGTVWTANTRTRMPSPPVCRFAQDRFSCVGRSEAIPLTYAVALHVDSRGDVWAGGDKGACRFSGETVRCFPIPALAQVDSSGVIDIASDPSGHVVASLGERGYRQFVDGQWRPLRVPALERQRSGPMMRDRRGSLWIGTSRGGAVRMTSSGSETFTSADGLSGDNIVQLFEDAESNVWVVTNGGLDRFRDVAVSTLTTREGLLEDNVMSVAPARDGGVWIVQASGGLLHAGGSGSIALRSGRELRPGHFNSALEDAHGRVWIGTNDGLFRHEHGKTSAINTPDRLPFGVVVTMAKDRDGDIWVSTTRNEHALVRVTDGVVAQMINAGTFGEGQVRSIAPDPSGGVWIAGGKSGPGGSTLYRYASGGGEPASSVPLLAKGGARNIWIDRDGLWVTAGGGLQLTTQGRTMVLDEPHGLRCARLTAAARDATGALWIKASCGITRIAPEMVSRWIEDSSTLVTGTLYDVFDGAPGAEGTPFGPEVSASSDGRLWFAAGTMSVQVVDPSRLNESMRMPPVRVMGITADHTPYPAAATVTLPPRTRDLQIDYTALSYKIPERVRFRYQLDGHDQAWQDAGGRRQAFYTNLEPGTYRFRVTASNDVGEWSDSSATVVLVLRPAFTQTVWFTILVASALAGVLWVVYALRMTRVTRAIQARMDERLHERERIARELHDTLLQGAYGLVLRFQAVADQIDPGAPVRHSIDDALERADRVVAEGRDRVEGLRTTDTGDLDLAQAFRDGVSDLSTGGRPELRITTTGHPRRLQPIVYDELFWIGREAIANAYRAADAAHIDVTVAFERREMRVTIRDDGRGIAPDILAAGGRPKHWGIRGMRERATRIGGRLSVSSQPSRGTSVDLRVPGRVAFADHAEGWPSWWRARIAKT